MSDSDEEGVGDTPGGDETDTSAGETAAANDPAAGRGVAEAAASDSAAEEVPEPTPQSVALRRQQRRVGTGGGILAGLAVAVILLQRFPDAPLVVPVLAGAAAGGAMLWLVRRSLFPAESLADEDAD